MRRCAVRVTHVTGNNDGFIPMDGQPEVSHLHPSGAGRAQDEDFDGSAAISFAKVVFRRRVEADVGDMQGVRQWVLRRQPDHVVRKNESDFTSETVSFLEITWNHCFRSNPIRVLRI